MATNPDAIHFTLLVFRVLVGLTLSAHGLNKFFGGGRIPGTARWFDSIGMRPGKVHALLAACTETGAGLLLALGLLTPLAGAAFVALMLVAAYSVNRPNGFFIANHGWEYNLVLALCGLLVAGVGPGRWSLDHALGLTDRFSGWTGLAIAAGVGLVGGVGQLVLFFRPPDKS